MLSQDDADEIRRMFVGICRVLLYSEVDSRSWEQRVAAAPVLASRGEFLKCYAMFKLYAEDHAENGEVFVVIVAFS